MAVVIVVKDVGNAVVSVLEDRMLEVVTESEDCRR